MAITVYGSVRRLLADILAGILTLTLENLSLSNFT